MADPSKTAPKKKKRPKRKPSAPAAPSPQRVRLDSLVFDLPEFQCRVAGIDPDHVAGLRERIETDPNFEPIIQARRLPDGRNVVTDGHHAGQAYGDLQRELVPAVIREGGWEDALLDATAANRDQFAKNRTRADVREAIRRTLQAALNWSDRRIAEHVKADHKTVATVRKEIVPTGEFPQSAPMREGINGILKPATKTPKLTEVEKTSFVHNYLNSKGDVGQSDESAPTSSAEPPRAAPVYQPVIEVFEAGHRWLEKLKKYVVGPHGKAFKKACVARGVNIETDWEEFTETRMEGGTAGGFLKWRAEFPNFMELLDAMRDVIDKRGEP